MKVSPPSNSLVEALEVACARSPCSASTTDRPLPGDLMRRCAEWGTAVVAAQGAVPGTSHDRAKTAGF